MNDAKKLQLAQRQLNMQASKEIVLRQKGNWHREECEKFVVRACGWRSCSDAIV